MTKDQALTLALKQLEFFDRSSHQHGCVWQKHLITAIKEALAQPEERNFCPRCGKRTADPTTIHTCTPPIAAAPKASYGFPHGAVSAPKAGGSGLTAGETAPTPATCHHSQANSALIAKLEAYERQTGNSQGLGKP